MKTLQIIICALAATSVMAQKSYTLDECRSMALAHNVAILNSANNISAAQETQKEAFTKYFPTVSATGTAYNANKPLLEMDMGQLGSMAMLKNGIMGGITLTQPVFAGGQIVNGNKLAKISVQVSKLQHEQSVDEVRLNVEKYYWQIVVLKEKIKTVEVVETMLSSLNKDVTAAVNAGMKMRNDLLQVQLKQSDMASIKLNLANNLSVCQMLLAQYIGAEEEQIDAVDNIDVTQELIFPHELYCEPSQAMALTPEYRLLQSNVEAERLKKNLAVDKNLPTVGVGAGYMYNDLMDKGNSFGVVFATVSVPISNWWGGSHDIKKHKLQLQNAQNLLNDNTILLQIKIQKAWNDLNNSWQQTHIAKQSIEQSEENLRLNQDYYKVGTTSMSDLLDAQMLYQQSRDKYIDAYTQYRIKETGYLIATGR